MAFSRMKLIECFRQSVLAHAGIFHRRLNPDVAHQHFNHVDARPTIA